MRPCSSRCVDLAVFVRNDDMPFALFAVLIDLYDHERDVGLIVSVDIQFQHGKISTNQLFFQQVASGGEIHDLSVFRDAEVYSPFPVQEIPFRRLRLDCVVGSVWQIVCSRFTDTVCIGGQRYDQIVFRIGLTVNQDVGIAVAVD